MAGKQVHIIHAPYAQPCVARIAAYVRVSSKSEEQLHSFHQQCAYYHELVTGTPGWELVDIYADEGLTGTRAGQREELNCLMRDCRAGRIDRILVKSVSRFARNTTDCLQYIRELKALGVSIYFEEEELDTADMSDEMLLTIRGIQAQHESMVNSRNARWSYKKRMEAGEFITIRAPFGYTRQDGVCDTLEIDVQAAPVVRWIFEAYLQGKGKCRIASELNNNGEKTAMGKAWTANAVRRVLHNEKYAGNALVQKTYTTNTFPFTRKVNHGEAPQYYIASSHEAIISNGQYDGAQSLTAWRRQYYTGKNTGERNPLARKLICAECGSTFKKKVVTSGTVTWACRKHNQSKFQCPVKNVREQEVYMAFIALYNRLKKRYRELLVPMRSYLEQVYMPVQGNGSELAALNEEIIQTSRKLTHISGLWEKGALSETLFLKYKGPLEQTLCALRRQRSVLQEASRMALADMDHFLWMIQTEPEVITDFHPVLFENLVDRILVSQEDALVFCLKGGLELGEAICRRSRR